MFKDLIKSSLIGIIAKIISAAGSFIIIPLMLKQFGTENFGVWMAISSTIGLASFLDLGIGNNLMNTLSKHNSANDKQAIEKSISFAYFIQLAFTLLIVLVFSLSFSYIDWKYLLNLKSGSYNDIIFFAFLFFLLNLFSNTIYSVQRGLQYLSLANKWILINSIFYLAGIYLVIIYKPDLRFIAIATFGIPFFISILNTIIFFRSRHISINLKWRSISFKSILEFSGRGFIFLYLQLASLIAFQTDSLVLAHTTNYLKVAEYNIAAKLYSIPLIFLSVYFQSLWPQYADSFAKSNWVLIKKNFYRSVLLSFIVSGLFVLVILVLRKPILTIWLKNDAIISTDLIVAFSVWTLVNSVIATNLGIIFNGFNILRVQVITSIGMVICNVILSIYLSGIMGASGVVWGSTISSVLFSCIPLLIYLHKIFKQH